MAQKLAEVYVVRALGRGVMSEQGLPSSHTRHDQTEIVSELTSQKGGGGGEMPPRPRVPTLEKTVLREGGLQERQVGVADVS